MFEGEGKGKIPLHKRLPRGLFGSLLIIVNKLWTCWRYQGYVYTTVSTQKSNMGTVQDLKTSFTHIEHLGGVVG